MQTQKKIVAKHTTPLPFPGGPEKKALIRTALGRESADLVIENARLVNVYTGEIFDQQSVAVRSGWIATVGPDAAHTIGDETTVLDAAGQTLIPGLIDAHTHLAWLFTVDEFLRYVIPGGTTTIVTETIEPFPVSGYAGVADFLDTLKGQPINILATAPPMMSISRTARGISQNDLDRLLERPEILGLGEAYWQSVIQETDRMIALFDQTLAAGKCLEGHSAGASARKLAAYVAAGVSSCHEPITAGEVLDRLRLGLHVMIREGSIRSDLEAIAAIKDTGVNTRRLVLVTDGVSPGDLRTKGYMEYVVQKAIDCGFSPVEAIQMATLNAAEHFGLDRWIGGIAPGKQADMLLVPDPETIRPSVVISRGNIVARNGQLLATPRKHRFLPSSLNSVNLPEPMKAEDFMIPSPPGVDPVRLRVIDLVTDLVTRESAVALSAVEGRIAADPVADLLKIAAIDRTHRPGKRFVGLIRGFGLTAGAMASSAAWDTADIVVVGANEADMAAAVNRIRDLNGGVVVCVDGHIAAELPLPVFGIMAELPMDALDHRIAAVTRQARRLGFPHDDPLLTLITLTGQAIPFFRICEEGLVNFKDGKTVDLFLPPVS